MGIEGRVAIVTGVTTGVGRGIAAELARLQVKVLGTGRREELGRELEREVRDEGGELTFVQADVSRVDDCRRTVDAALEAFGRVDILVNNAATVGDPPLVDSHTVTEEWWDQIVDTNLKGAFFCSRFALEPMRAQESGSIVNIASINGVNFGPTRMAAYTASKAGLIALSKNLACEYAAHGIRVNVIILGRTVGDSGEAVMNATRRERMGDDYAPVHLTDIPGLFTGRELGAIVAFLCDDAANFVNGAAIPVDGGITAGMAHAALSPEDAEFLSVRLGFRA
jgi:NAD(P)-dependent dehydrogenase (short-subunit alcohol dehydrogenase family)